MICYLRHCRSFYCPVKCKLWLRSKHLFIAWCCTLITNSGFLYIVLKSYSPIYMHTAVLRANNTVKLLFTYLIFYIVHRTAFDTTRNSRVKALPMIGKHARRNETILRRYATFITARVMSLHRSQTEVCRPILNSATLITRIAMVMQRLTRLNGPHGYEREKVSTCEHC